MDWKVLIITYNIGMQKGTEKAVDALLADVLKHKPQVVAVGMQEVAHAETMGGVPLNWHRLMVDWMAAKAGMVLLTNTFQATNTIAVWIKRNLLGMIRKVDFRFAKNTMGGLTGHKGSIGVRIQLNGIHSIVFVDSHFVHDVIAYERRLAQFASNHECSFPEDKSVRAAFWFGDLNFRVEKEPQEMEELIGKEQTYSVLDTHEQLRRAQTEKKAFANYKEPEIKFRPTYRLCIGSTNYDLKRTPSWCDRVLYKSEHVTPLAYESNANVLSSDHLPVQALFLLKFVPAPTIQWDTVFEHIPPWYSTVPLICRFQHRNNYWAKRGSYMDWVGLFPSTIDDCTTALKWTYVMTCQSQTVQDHFYYVCEFYNVPPGNYRLGYYSLYSKCLNGLSGSIEVIEQPLAEG
ncbi:hypothetical protein WR25_21414 [Diploscapter pachys]|uniref:Inositol polyphosphate-related phosphatase domain-containing protein n=1 Tax=Diploscapter pachys TaxID=2018661 RepID=A0A2A2JCK2_9BILA|nr:hypothetical protein WR25_21414 [Diploscapter pachys]